MSVAVASSLVAGRAAAAAAPAASVLSADWQTLHQAADRACALLRTLAHRDRLVLLCQLSQGEYCVSDLEALLGIRQPTLSQQLGVLRQEGLVQTRRQGKHVFYRLDSEDAAAVLRTLYDRFCPAPADR